MMVTLRSAMSRLAMLIELADNLFLRHQSDDLIGELAVLEDQQGQDAENHEAAGDARVLVHVHLRHRRAAVVFGGDGVDHGRQAAARTAPFGPEVHERHAVLDFAVEVAVGERLDLFRCHRFPPAGPQGSALPLTGGSQKTRPTPYPVSILCRTSALMRPRENSPAFPPAGIRCPMSHPSV